MYLALDIETGGIGHDKSLLTAFFALLNNDFEIVNELELKIKPDNGIYNVTAEALTINKINLIEHDKVAEDYKMSATRLYFWLQTNYNNQAQKEKFIPMGHGVGFDCKFLTATLLSQGSWDAFVSYRTLDTSPIARFLMIAGYLPQISGSLESLVKYFGIEKRGELHDAKTDVLASIEVFKRLLALVSRRNNFIAGEMCPICSHVPFLG